MPTQQNPAQKWPERSPLDLVPALSDILTGKSVCDIGCGAGDLLEEIRCLGISDKVVGIELMSSKVPASRRSHIICGDLRGMELPVCDVYLLWVNDDLYSLVADLPSGSVFVDITSAPTEKQLAYLGTQGLLLEKREFKFDERRHGLSEGFTEERWPLTGTRNVFIYRKL